MTEEQLSALLRLKRYEQPPAEYFDQLLRDIHHRQRAELLHRPLWRIALDRVQTLFSEHSMGGYSYAGSMAAVLIVGLGAIGLLTPGTPEGEPRGPITTKTKDGPELERFVTLQETAQTPRLAARSLATPPLTLAPPAPPVLPPPHYVIDSRPASYAPPSSFNF